jgi:hypothetical protein
MFEAQTQTRNLLGFRFDLRRKTGKLEGMDSDERDICNYLRGFRGQYIGLAEIARRAAGKRRYREDPNWALPVLGRLMEKHIIEGDATGHYRFKQTTKEDRRKKRWVAPHIRKILQDSGKDFGEAIKVDDPEDELGDI